MANPKYADLPGIAFDQPDVYETCDLPESDQSHNISEAILDQSDSVEPIKISATEAYDRFKGKSLDCRNVDFTDSIAHKRKTGYGVAVGEYVMLDNASKANETPLETYNRLQFEVKDLLEQVDQIKSTGEKDEITPAALSEQIEVIQKELQNLQLEQILGSEIIQDMSDPLKSSHTKLLLQLENYKRGVSTDKKSTPSSATASSTDALTYELYIKPETSKLEELSKISELEQRLKNLEGLVGQDKNKLNFLTANTDEKSIVAGIRLLSSKLNLLDPAYLQEIETRLMVLHQCMQQVAEKKQQIEDAEKQNKVTELYDLAKKVEGMSVALPQVVDRLVALKSLHEQALQFSKALTQLDVVQQQMTNSLHSNQDLLKKLQDTFVQNNEMIEKNISSLNTRMEVIKKFEK